ncbi:MAG: ECF transporter S component [Christensenellales bacterium]
MKKNTFRLVLSALFVSLVLLLGMTPLGLIPLGFINVTVLCVPVLVGTLLLGIKTGLLLGFAFGTVSALAMLGMTLTPPSALAGALLAAKPVYAFLMCYVPRLLTPVVAYAVYRALSKGKRSIKALPIAAACGSLTNTVFYLGLMYLFYSLVPDLEAEKIVALIAGTGILAGGAEAVVAALLSVPIVTALWKTGKLPEEENA